MIYLYRQERLKLEEEIRMSRTNQQQQLDEDIRMARINQQTTVHQQHQQHQEQHLHQQHEEQHLHQVKNFVQPFVLPIPWVF